MKTIFALLLALLMSNASAGVQYQWELVQPSATTPRPMTMNITFSNTVVRSGRAEYRFLCRESAELYCAIDPASPIRALNFSISGATPIEFFPGSRKLMTGSDLFVSVNFLPDGYLTGSIYAVSRETDFRMSSVGTLFTLDRANSDAFEDGCLIPYVNGNSECFGATGFIRAVPTNVPEPSTVALLVAALGGLLVSRRKRVA